LSQPLITNTTPVPRRATSSRVLSFDRQLLLGSTPGTGVSIYCSSSVGTYPTSQPPGYPRIQSEASLGLHYTGPFDSGARRAQPQLVPDTLHPRQQIVALNRLAPYPFHPSHSNLPSAYPSATLGSNHITAFPLHTMSMTNRASDDGTMRRTRELDRFSNIHESMEVEQDCKFFIDAFGDILNRDIKQPGLNTIRLQLN
jgi:hypothetical protein